MEKLARVAMLTLLLVLLGCTTNDFTTAEYDKDATEKLPAISIFSAAGSSNFRSQCRDFDGRSVLHHCQLNSIELDELNQTLAESGVFEAVHYADEDTSYQLVFTTASYNHEGGDELGSAVLAGASLMLLPLVTSAEVKVEALLMWNGFTVHQFDYVLPFTIRSSWFNMNEDLEKEVANSIASHVIDEMQDADVFAPALLAEKLESTNYTRDFVVPESFTNYQTAGTFLYTHPFAGVQARYMHTDEAKSYGDIFVDIFVYPVRSSDWDRDQQQLLEQEISGVRKDMELMHKQSDIEAAKFTEIGRDRYAVHGREIDAVYLESIYDDMLGNSYSSKTTVTIVGDKFVKFRHTGLTGDLSRAELQAFAEEILGLAAIPEESTFMAMVRKQWRDEEEI